MNTASQPHQFSIGETEFLLDGEPFLIRCGEIHFTRVPPALWQHRLQMCKAMGLNTVCVYLFWNFHEWEEGRFNWEGWADVAQFCCLAQQEGLWVLLRPGPYSCAEWEMGGLPWWLVNHDEIGLRTSDPLFLEPATRYLREVGRVLAPLQVTQGGPLLMVQVENEYGSFGKDADYMGACRQALLDGGFDVPLFACNPPHDIQNGYRDDLLQVANFGPGGAKSAFETLRKFQPSGPLMNGEFYPAWFDTWGRPHHKGEIEAYIRELEYMLENRHSFSIYMAHGGTSFGLWAGADRPFRPDTSSYDYAAPISEAGWPTEKFWRSREVMARYLNAGEVLPDVPESHPIIEIPAFKFQERAAIWSNLPAPTRDATPRHMEAYGQSRGAMVYRTTVPAGEASTLEAHAVHDFGWVFLNGQANGVLDRRGGRFKVSLPARESEMTLDILVEAMGRVNFGREVFDRKGIHAPVTLDGSELHKWEVFSLSLATEDLKDLHFSQAQPNQSGPAYWHATFNLQATGDTFLNLSSWGKGIVWVNGHCLGRFWNIGPTQTMYCPAVWLRTGQNEVVVLDWLGPELPILEGLKSPILDELRPELDFSRPMRAVGELRAQEPVAQGHFEPQVKWQEIGFDCPVTGRYLCLESLSSHDGGPFTAVAELDARGADGQLLSKTDWKIVAVSSEEIVDGDGLAENILDGQSASSWHTAWSSEEKPSHPHHLVLDLGDSVTLSGLRYLPRAGEADATGRVKDYYVFVSDTPFGLQLVS